MSSMIRAAWIRPAVEEKLRQIIQWRSADTPDRIKDGYQIIGDSVWVKMGGASPLQIIKFIAYEGEIEAWLSDAKSSIHATFSFAAFDAERAITGRRFTDGSLGGIVGIEDYELRVRWPDTAPWPRLIMYVRRASYLGSGGEGIFGNPTYILSDQRIKDLMVSISTLELSDPEPMEDRAEVEPMVQSQGSDSQLDTRGLDGGGGTQNEFSTQVRQSRPAPSGRRTRAPHNSGSGVKRHDQGSVMTAMDVSDKVKQRAKANNLIRLLPQKRDTPRAVGVVQEVPKHLSIVPEEDTRRDAGQKAAQASGPIPVLIAEAVSLVHLEGVAQIHARDSGGTDGMESNLATGSAEGNRYISGAETGAVGGATTSQNVQTHLARGENLGADPWAGMTRISRREACISKDQDELLSGKNCWIPPEPGNRAPVANIPVPILCALSAKAEELAMREKEASEATKNRTEEGSQSESDSCSDTGVELEWSPSPVRPRCVMVDEMPVDSSPEGVSLANAESQSAVAYQPSTQGRGSKSRRKREETLSDDQDSSPIVKRQRKGGYGEKESRSARNSFRGRQSPRDRGVTPTSSPMDWRDVEEEVNPSTGGNADGRPARAAELQTREHSSLHGVGKSAFESTPDYTFSPIDEGTQASQHATACTQANIVAMVEVERTETELEVDSSNYFKSPERPEACVDAATEQVSRVINTQERSQTLDGKMGGSDTDGEHELETSFPAALGDEADNVGHNANSVISLQLPSTAPQIRKPIVQVKQTAHLYNQGPERSHRDGILVSRGETGSPDLRNSVDPSNPVIPCTFPKTMVRVEIPVGARGHRLATGGGSRDSVLVSPQVESETQQRHLQLHPSDKMDEKEYVNRRLATELGSNVLTQTGTLKGHDPKHLNSLAIQTSEPGVPSMSPSGAPASRPSRRDYAVSASVSSHTPLKTLLSSPAHLKTNVPSSVLDWLEKTSSVGSDSVDNVSDPREQQWWHDRNTPFKEWCRAYVSLKSVNGAMGKVDRETGNIIPPPVQMDVLNWSLP